MHDRKIKIEKHSCLKTISFLNYLMSQVTGTLPHLWLGALIHPMLIAIISVSVSISLYGYSQSHQHL